MTITRLNHAVLYVRDAERAAAFYRDVLGFEVATEMPGAVFLRGGGSDNHHDLGLFSIGDGAAGPQPGRVGLYHLAWQVATIEDLAELAQTLRDAGALVGASDHGVTKSLYAKDLDGNEFEIMFEVPRETWTPELATTAIIRPLDLPAEAGPLGQPGEQLERGRVPRRSPTRWPTASPPSPWTAPTKLNAFTVRMQQEICAAVDEVDADPEVRVVVVTGGAAASAPAPTSAAARRPSTTAADAARARGRRPPPRRGWPASRCRFFGCTKPIIGAINGPAVGIGMTMTLPMDVRLASTTAKFGFVFARRGLVPEAARRGSSPASSASAGRWSGAPPAGCSSPTRPSRPG